MSSLATLETSSTTALIPSSRSYARSGIGGIGNYHKVTPSTSHLTKSRPAIKSKKSGSFMTGIGGAGNCHAMEEQATANHSEARARRALQKENRSTAWHHGIGGVGNQAYYSDGASTSSISSRSSSTSRKTEHASVAEKMKEKLVGYFASSA
ncbi:hypothetical protein B0J14DRAFT_11723 [Halenospora varia]|nr:hypothetical protein B0J14DRAFT_11723 [Halenospora varia]